MTKGRETSGIAPGQGAKDGFEVSAAAVALFTSPWPGPGNREGPGDPELPLPWTASRQVEAGNAPGSNTQLSVMTDAWPGPGDSEGPVETDAE